MQFRPIGSTTRLCVVTKSLFVTFMFVAFKLTVMRAILRLLIKQTLCYLHHKVMTNV